MNAPSDTSSIPPDSRETAPATPPAPIDGWPAHAIEVTAWRTNPDARDSTGRRPPYEDRVLSQVAVSIPPRIAAVSPLLSTATILAVEAATARVVELEKGTGLQLGALSGFLLRSESVATSRIERIHADLDEFARAVAGQRAGAEARRTAAAVTAIAGLVDRASTGPITTESIDAAHRALLADDPLEGDFAGVLRPMQSWIGGSDFSPRGAVYVPPPASQVGELLDDVVAMADRTDISTIAQAAIVHAQFESIHPYTDGNGRIGRAMINAVLRRRGLTTNVVVPIASVMLADVDRYFAQLDGYRSGDVDTVVRYLADATEVAAVEAATSATRLSELPERWRAGVRVRRGSAADRLLDRLLQAPVLTDKSAAAIVDGSVRRIYDALDRLTEAEILTEVTGNKRDRVWVVADVLDEIDRLEERIGRRRLPTAGARMRHAP